MSCGLIDGSMTNVRPIGVGSGSKGPRCSLKVGYYKRTNETNEAKRKHVEAVDRTWSSREDMVLMTTLANADVVL